MWECVCMSVCSLKIKGTYCVTARVNLGYEIYGHIKQVIANKYIPKWYKDERKWRKINQEEGFVCNTMVYKMFGEFVVALNT